MKNSNHLLNQSSIRWIEEEEDEEFNLHGKRATKKDINYEDKSEN